jgi:Mg2+ and Co2+ transporter CorA
MATQVKGTLSEYTIMERYLGVEQPDDEEERKMIEAVSHHPLTIQYSIMKELKRRADANDEVAAQVLQQMQAQTAPQGQPGRPEEPNNPEQLTGTQSPTGQPVPQAMGQQPGESPMEQMGAMANAAPQMTSGLVQ